MSSSPLDHPEVSLYICCVYSLHTVSGGHTRGNVFAWIPSWNTKQFANTYMHTKHELCCDNMPPSLEHEGSG